MLQRSPSGRKYWLEDIGNGMWRVHNFDSRVYFDLPSNSGIIAHLFATDGHGDFQHDYNQSWLDGVSAMLGEMDRSRIHPEEERYRRP